MRLFISLNVRVYQLVGNFVTNFCHQAYYIVVNKMRKMSLKLFIDFFPILQNSDFNSYVCNCFKF